MSFKNFVAAVLCVPLLTIAGAGTAIAGEIDGPPSGSADEICTHGDVQRMLGAMPQAFETGSGAAARCQIRLYDGNDDVPDSPEVPHDFTDRDWVLAGILQWSPRDVLDELGLKRADGVSYLTNDVVDLLFWGRKGETLDPIPLTHTNYRGWVYADGGGRLVGNQRYHVFAPGSLEPGEYEWRYESHDLLFGDSFEAFGEVHIR